jgi:D-aminoacyl-tRNA deacylase
LGIEVAKRLELSEATVNGVDVLSNDDVVLANLNKRIINTGEEVRGFEADAIIFLSRHKSADGVEAFTVHATGNWSDDADYGGEPKTLSVAAPYLMANVLRHLNKANTTGFEVTYEATHHGPTTEIPSLFVEAGGPESIDAGAYPIAAEALVCALGAPEEAGEVVIGIGSGHYPRRFTARALESKYAMAHMMPKYHCANVDMLGAAVGRSKPVAERALIEWKSLKSSQRSEIIKRLDELGIDHVRV